MAYGEINKYNLVRWTQKSGTAIAFDSRFRPNGYLRYQSDSFPILVPGEKLSFFINTPISNSLPHEIYIGDTVVNNSLISIAIDGGYIYYIDCLIPNMLDGIVRLYIKNGSTVILQSNLFMIMNSNYTDKSVKLKFRNSTNLYNNLYEKVAGLYTEIRVFMNEIDPQFETTLDQYKSVTTGLRRNYKESVEKYIKMETYFFDYDMSEAMPIVLEHDEIYFNNRRVSVKEGFKINFDPSKETNKGEFTIYDVEFTTDKFANSVDPLPTPPTYYSVEKTGSFTKNDCEGGYLGSSVVYTVLADSYTSLISQADADAKAQEDVDLNGQAYANENGTCALSVLINGQFSAGQYLSNYAAITGCSYPTINGKAFIVWNAAGGRIRFYAPPSNVESQILGLPCKITLSLANDTALVSGMNNGQESVSYMSLKTCASEDLTPMAVGENVVNFNYPSTAQTYAFELQLNTPNPVTYNLVAVLASFKLELD